MRKDETGLAATIVNFSLMGDDLELDMIEEGRADASGYCLRVQWFARLYWRFTTELFLMYVCKLFNNINRCTRY